MSETKVVELAKILDLDAYRLQREAEGSWPLPEEEYLNFWKKWRDSRPKPKKPRDGGKTG